MRSNLARVVNTRTRSIRPYGEAARTAPAGTGIRTAVAATLFVKRDSDERPDYSHGATSRQSEPATLSAPAVLALVDERISVSVGFRSGSLAGLRSAVSVAGDTTVAYAVRVGR